MEFQTAREIVSRLHFLWNFTKNEANYQAAHLEAQNTQLKAPQFF